MLNLPIKISRGQLKKQCHVISNIVLRSISDKVMGGILHPEDLKDHHQPEYIVGKVTIGNIFCNIPETVNF